MDKLEQLGQQLSQVTMYDIKSYYNQAKSMVLNLSEMETKVREATNDDPWGASSTLMNEIAAGTFNFQNFNEIMPAIYARFMEKEARQWRQIYKALQLLEHLIKNGSERTVDDARSHISTIKMLRNFHYIDEKGKDQGINVRNRSREIAELLSDLDKVRAERRKAKGNRSKYVGTGNDGEMSFSSGGSRYGGFGSDALYGSSGGGNGGSYDRDNGGSSSYGGGGGGGSSGGFRDDRPRRGYEEYDAGDDEDLPRRSASSAVSPSSRSAPPKKQSSIPAAAPPKAKVPEVDLLGGFDDEPTPAAPVTPATEKALPPTGGAAAANVFDTNDDFGDFEGAPQAQAAPVQPQAKPNVFEFLSQSQAPLAAQPMHARQLSGGAVPTMGSGMGAMGSMGGSMGMGGGMMSPTNTATTNSMSMGMMQPQRTMSATNTTAGGMLSPTSMSSSLQAAKPAAAQSQAKPSGGGFDDLWSMSLGSSSAPKKAAAGGGKSIQELEKEKAQAGIWGGGGGAKPAQNNLFGDFGGTSSGGAGGGGNDDLLL